MQEITRTKKQLHFANSKTSRGKENSSSQSSKLVESLEQQKLQLEQQNEELKTRLAMLEMSGG
jgi:exonuclease VII small subunit